MTPGRVPASRGVLGIRVACLPRAATPRRSWPSRAPSIPMAPSGGSSWSVRDGRRAIAHDAGRPRGLPARPRQPTGAPRADAIGNRRASPPDKPEPGRVRAGGTCEPVLLGSLATAKYFWISAYRLSRYLEPRLRRPVYGDTQQRVVRLDEDCQDLGVKGVALGAAVPQAMPGPVQCLAVGRGVHLDPQAFAAPAVRPPAAG